MSLGQCPKEWWNKTTNESDSKFEDRDNVNGDIFVVDLNSDGIVSRFDRVSSKRLWL
jgi:hypothetical protein